MPSDGQSLAAPAAEVAGFGNENTRGHGAGYQDRWAVGAGAAGAWLAVADGIGGGPAGKEAAQVAIGLAQVVLGSGELTEAELYQVFDSAYVALRPWWVQERGGGTTLTVAAMSKAGLLMAAVGDSPAYVDFGAGFESPEGVAGKRGPAAAVDRVVALAGARDSGRDGDVRRVGPRCGGIVDGGWHGC